jgi:hypothetical protein
VRIKRHVGHGRRDPNNQLPRPGRNSM